jgi:hypothetical protein
MSGAQPCRSEALNTDSAISVNQYPVDLHPMATLPIVFAIFPVAI